MDVVDLGAAGGSNKDGAAQTLGQGAHSAALWCNCVVFTVFISIQAHSAAPENLTKQRDHISERTVICSQNTFTNAEKNLSYGATVIYHFEMFCDSPTVPELSAQIIMNTDRTSKSCLDTTNGTSFLLSDISGHML